MNITDRTLLQTVRSTFTTFDIKPPKPLAEAMAKADKLSQSQIRNSSDDVERAVSAAILDGRDPSSDPDVQQAVTARSLANMEHLPAAMSALAMDEVREVCSANLDIVVNAWAKVFDAAGADLAAAHQRLGNLELDDTVSIVALGGDIADVWAKAQQAQHRTDAILNAWVHLLLIVHVSVNPAHRALRLAPLTLAQWRELPAKATSWDVVRSGVSLSLPTLDEYRARVVAVEKAISTPETVVNAYRSHIAGREIREAVA